MGCINAHVQASLEFMTAEIRDVCLAVLEERHPIVLVSLLKRGCKVVQFVETCVQECAIYSKQGAALCNLLKIGCRVVQFAET